MSALPFMPNKVGEVMMPPSLYHWIDSFGTLGGDREKLPLMEKWGSLMDGKLSFNPEK
jgi:hypothetical protein